MGRHLSEDVLLELAGGPSGAREVPHLRDCAACREQLEELRATLARLHEAQVPEPSPLYWEAFRRQVARRLDEDRRAPGRRFAAWLWLPALASAALVAALVAPRLVAPRAVPQASSVPLLPAWSALPAPDRDSGLLVLRALAGEEEFGAVADVQEVDAYVADLDEGEALGLARALRAERPGGES